MDTFYFSSLHPLPVIDNYHRREGRGIAGVPFVAVTIAEVIKDTRKKSRAARFASLHVIIRALGSCIASPSSGYSQIRTVFPKGRRAGRSFINSLLPSLHFTISSAFGNCQPPSCFFSFAIIAAPLFKAHIPICFSFLPAKRSNRGGVSLSTRYRPPNPQR